MNLPIKPSSIKKKDLNKDDKLNKISAKKMTKSDCVQFFEILQKDNPEPKTELHYGSEFQLLIAVLLSAQSTDKGVNKATEAFFRDAPTPDAMYVLGVEGIKQYIKTIGLFNSKANHIYQTCEILIKQHQGNVPKIRNELESLPGVGRKTANVILNTAFNQPTMAVDTHIFRVANRTGLAPGKNVLEVEHGLLKIIPEKFMQHAHHWLILLGRYTCVARAPKCASCRVYKFCRYEEKTE